MKAFGSLPEGYGEIYSVDLKKNKKLSLLVNGIAIVICVVMAVVMNFYVPFSTLFDMKDGFVPYIIRFVSLMLLSVLYIVLHEIVHGIAMKICGTKKVKYGFTGVYAYAGSDDYYDKKGYIFIALAPVVLWGIVLAVVNFLVPASWFWVIYIIQISNVGGAAGDYFVTVRFSRLPKDILVKDYGVGMVVYSKEK
ncbi:MAG: DUF3267 domain-containing protein [Clostridia bacterium]|nr:DUF3267 domain-containing protein [Clostridia bacterium]MBR2388878.1 DUF3267 domain-containing protein [Clostridia bacterium]